MSLFSWKPKPPKPPKPPQPIPVSLSAWFEGALFTAAPATLIPDQFGGKEFTATVSNEGRYLFTLPPNTNFLWGAWLHIDGTEATAPVDMRVNIGQVIDGRNVWQIEDIAIEPAVAPFVPCDRVYRGNMCGIRVAGLPPIPGVKDPSLVLSWFIDRYDQPSRARIYAAYHQRGIVDVLVSWPDSRANGSSPEQFGAFCEELVNEGFAPSVMLSSKYYDPKDDWRGVQRNIEPVLPYITQVAGRWCVGWELSLWLSPADVQQLTDWLAPLCNPWGGKLYVHFQQGYASYDVDGPNASFAGYWNRNIGKLTGVLHQRDLSWSKNEYQARLVDILERFAGNYFCSPDSGFGHPFDCIALEITAQDQYDGSMSEAEGNHWGDVAIHTPASHGPFGPVVVMGSGNGQTP